MESQYKACSVSEDGFTPPKKFKLKKVLFRYVGQLFICLLGFGLYFCYDNPGALQNKFEEKLSMTKTEFAILYSVYSWPNVILCFFGGFLLDSVFGIRWGTIIYSFLALCGQLLFATGAYVEVFWLMVLGRFIFGIGSESVYIAQNNYTVLWFRGKALNAIFGLQWSFGQAGSIVNQLTLADIYNFVSENSNYSGPESIGIVLFIASMVCGTSMICALILGCMDNYTEIVLQPDKDIKQPDRFKLADIKTFNRTYWLIVLLCTAYTVALYPFISFAQGYFVTKHGFKAEAANRLISLVYTISAITSPLYGIIIDKFARNILWVLIGIVGSLLSHGLLAFTHVSPHACMIMLGLFSSLFGTSTWPMIAQVMPEHQLGTAYGINQAIINMSIAVVSIVCGKILDVYSYPGLDLFFLIWLLISLVPGIMIWKSTSKPIAETDCAIEKHEAGSNGLEVGLLQSSVEYATKTPASNEQEFIQMDNKLLSR